MDSNVHDENGQEAARRRYHNAAVAAARATQEYLKDRPVGESKRGQRTRMEQALQTFSDAEVRLSIALAGRGNT